MSTIFEQPKGKISLNRINIKGIFKNKDFNHRILLQSLCHYLENSVSVFCVHKGQNLHRS